MEILNLGGVPYHIFGIFKRNGLCLGTRKYFFLIIRLCFNAHVQDPYISIRAKNVHLKEFAHAFAYTCAIVTVARVLQC
jgi:hypothetical protein